jgi:radical SAM protein with 4Fe4S-binding SPASM domain
METTNICNFKCDYCPESLPDYSQKSGGLFKIDIPTFNKIADQIKYFNTVKTLNLYMMGEPFVNKDILEFVRYAKDISAAERVIITSNGSLIRPDMHDAICRSGLDYLRISIYGSNEYFHKSKTKSAIPLSKIRSNISELLKYRNAMKYSHPFVYMKMIESENKEENLEFMEYFSGVGDEITVEPVMNWNGASEKPLSNVDDKTLMERAYFSNKKSACPFPFYTLVIHSDLNVSVCCVDWDKKAVVGNLNHESLGQIWAGERLRNFQIAHLNGKRSQLPGCKNCTYIHTAPDNIDTLTAQEFVTRTVAG